MRKHRDNIISIHFYFCALFIVTCIECTTIFVEYDLFNESGNRVIGLSIFNVVLKSFRNTLSRLVGLLIALGYGIIMNTIGRYMTNICLMCFMFFVSMMIHMAAQYINQYSLRLSTGVFFLMNMPLVITDILFAVWIALALRRSLTYLTIKNQVFKLTIMKNFTMIMLIGCTLIIFTAFTQIF